MKSLLTAALALIAVGGMPALAQESLPLAESPTTEAITSGKGGKAICLVLRTGYKSKRSYFAIPTASMEQCEMSGAELVTSKRLNVDAGDDPDYHGFECVEGIR